MPLIYCETNRIKENEFEFIQTYYVGASPIAEDTKYYTVLDNDRLLAAIVNVGTACRKFADRIDSLRDAPLIVGIESDVDGKDKRHGGEHDILFRMLCPANDFEARKVISLYHCYERYLGRIKQLSGRYNIKIVLQDRESELVKYS